VTVSFQNVQYTILKPEHNKFMFDLVWILLA